MSAEIRPLAVVTGAGAGMGAAAARELARRGFHVLAGVRRDNEAEAIGAWNIEPVILDITRHAHIEELARRVAAGPGPLRALVNNAGVGLYAPVETLPLDLWRRTFEVNVFGHIAVTQALLPALLASSGRVVNIGSVNGKIALAANSTYSATKFAMEAVSDSLRREVAPLGVQVSVVEPSAVRTALLGSGTAATRDHTAAMSPEQAARYGRLMDATVRYAAAFTEHGVTADRAALVIARAVTDRRPRTRYAIGRDAAMFTLLARVLPDRMLDRALARALRPHYTDKPDTRVAPGSASR